jgi:hypothetical protein
MKCPKGAVKHRISKGHGKPSNYAHSIRGHTWLKKGNETICKNCGKKQ